jgi:hypothetical protein
MSYAYNIQQNYRIDDTRLDYDCTVFLVFCRIIYDTSK